MRDLLVRGMFAGILAAALAIGFAYVVGEPEISDAIAFEEQHAHAGAAPDAAAEPEVVSRPVQSTIGLATGLGTLGVAFGGLFAVAFAFAQGRLGGLGPRGTTLLLALTGFTAVYVVPFLKYPPNPPATGDPETIASRTVLYFGLLLISVAAAAGAVILQRKLAADGSGWNAAIVAGGAFALVIAAAMLVMPSANEVPLDFPAVLLWRFRLASLGMQLVLWMGIGLIFGALTERATQTHARQALCLVHDPAR
jgi:predicted cobalt transporter CbtA